MGREQILQLKKMGRAVVLGNAALALLLAANSTSRAVAQAGGDTVITQPTAKPKPQGPISGVLFPYSLLDKALREHADKTGLVNYATLKGDPSLSAFVDAVGAVDLASFPVITKKDAETGATSDDRGFELIFWINAYNGLVLKTISDAYPVNSTGDIKDFETAKVHSVAGQLMSLREIRDRAIKLDPRALFALSNGTIGGPLLAPAAYRYITLNALLDNAVATYVSDPRNVNLIRIQSKVTVSDFLRSANSLFSKNQDPKRMEGVRNLLAKYTTVGGNRNFFTTTDYILDFTPASGSLNQQKR